MSEIRPAEVSEILKKELAGLDNASQYEEVGVVLEVGDGIARIYGLNDVQSGELIEFKNGSQGIVLNLESDHVGAVLMDSSHSIKQGDNLYKISELFDVSIKSIEDINNFKQPTLMPGQIIKIAIRAF